MRRDAMQYPDDTALVSRLCQGLLMLGTLESMAFGRLLINGVELDPFASREELALVPSTKVSQHELL